MVAADPVGNETNQEAKRLARGGILKLAADGQQKSAQAKLSEAGTEIMRGRTPKKSRLRTC